MDKKESARRLQEAAAAQGGGLERFLGEVIPFFEEEVCFFFDQADDVEISEAYFQIGCW